MSSQSVMVADNTRASKLIITPIKFFSFPSFWQNAEALLLRPNAMLIGLYEYCEPTYR